MTPLDLSVYFAILSTSESDPDDMIHDNTSSKETMRGTESMK